MRPASEKRVLLLVATARDAEVTRLLLEKQALSCVICSDLPDVARHIEGGVGGILLTDQVLTESGLDELLIRLDAQPAWSDIPVVILVRGETMSAGLIQVVERIRNVTLLDRPAATRSVVSALQAAVRSRERQYQIRDQLQIIRESLVSERAARAEAERAARAKDEFLASLSHELRTPLNAILGWTQLLRRLQDLSPDLAEGLAVIERNSRAQAQLIEDLLDMSRITVGKFHLELQVVDLVELSQAVLNSIVPAADARNVRVKRMIDPAPCPVRGDSSRLQQVIWNLLSNAIKFTPAGGTVQISLCAVGGNARLTVEDTGVGISPEFLPHLFERFRQADASTTRRFGGLGIGLALVKNLVDLHNGQVWATSPGEGQGSTFVVELPLVRPAQAGSANLGIGGPRRASSNYARSSGVLRGVSVLIVDDEEDARNLVARVLGEFEARVMVAASGSSAREILMRERPSVLLSDIGMPDEDGYEFIQKVRQLPASQGGQTPAAALTAFARTEDRAKALQAGYQSHIAKPVEPWRLVSVVAELAGKEETLDAQAGR